MVTRTALAELVAVRSPALLRTAYLLTGERGLAEDLVQEAIAKVLRQRHRVLDAQALEGYVRTTMLRTAISWRRLRSSTEVVMADLPENASGEAVNDDRAVMWALLQRLPVQQRAVVVLAYYEDLAEVDIAELLGCSVGAVKSHRARALRRLRTTMGTATGRPELSGTEDLG